jgi:hypothetical protein
LAKFNDHVKGPDVGHVTSVLLSRYDELPEFHLISGEAVSTASFALVDQPRLTSLANLYAEYQVLVQMLNTMLGIQHNRNLYLVMCM